MATQAWYGVALQTIVETGSGWTADDIKAVLQCSEHYTPDMAADDQLADIGTVLATRTSAAFASKANVLGVLDAANQNFPTVAALADHDIDYVVNYNDTDAGDPLLMCFDVSPALTPNGGDILVTWGNVAGTLLAKI
jgi:hypothetical protein